MKPSLFSETAALWQKISDSPLAGNSGLIAESNERLLSIFQVGGYYHWIFNLRELKFDYMSESVKEVLGFTAEEMDVPTLMNNVHPEDQSWFLMFERKVIEFSQQLEPKHIPDYKYRFDFRMNKKHGGHVRILNQVVALEYDETGAVFRTFGVHTDITHLKPEGRPILSFIGLNGQPSFIDVEVGEMEYKGVADLTGRLPDELTSREKQVLILLISGMISKEIAEVLNIGKQTVESHRKNMMNKANARNTAELVAKAVRSGWV